MWIEPEGGPYQVAIDVKLYEARAQDIENFFGRPLAKYSHNFVHERRSYTVFMFAKLDEAESFRRAFNGEPFDPRDIGGGSKWMFWFKGRQRKRDAKRGPYDFRS